MNEENKCLISDNQGLKYERVDLINKVNQLKKQIERELKDNNGLREYIGKYRQQLEKIKERVNKDNVAWDEEEIASDVNKILEGKEWKVI